MFKTIIVVSAIAATLLPAVPAQAQESGTVHVSYVDLNLASDAGRNSLERRVAIAARTVCLIEDSRELALWSSTRECRRDAFNGAQPAVEAAVAAARRATVTVTGAAAAIVVSNHR